jgi:hypothetical protein
VAGEDRALGRMTSRLALGLLGASLVAANASATPAVRITWDECGGCTTISASAGASLTARVSIEAGAAGISSYGVSVRFDDDLVLASVDPSDVGRYPEELLPAGFQLNLGSGIDGIDASTSTILTFEAATLDNGPTNTAFDVGIVHFVVADPKRDGTDLIAGLFNAGIDDLFANDGGELSSATTFEGAAVIPEPDAFAQLILAFGALVGIRAHRAWKRPLGPSAGAIGQKGF